MKLYFFLSLCAITPFLLKAEETTSKMFEDTDLLFEDTDLLFYKNLEAPQAAEKPACSIVFETTEIENTLSKEEPQDVALEKNDSSDATLQQEWSKDLADAPQKAPEADYTADKMCADPTMCMPDIEPFQANVRHTESKGIGYTKGYTTLEGLFTFSRNRYIPFLDLRGHVFDNGRLAANVGIGTRYLINPSKSMVGVNTYYDYRNLKHAHFNQWGLGLEGFYKRWELRINGYLPVGKKKIVTDHDLNWISFKRFQNNNIWINENYTDKIQTAKKGFNLEAAVHPFKIMRDYDCIVAAGPYYFGGEGESSWGVKVRIKTEIAKYVFVELSDSYDRIFHNRFQGTLMLSLPFGGKKCYPKRTPSTGECFADNIMVWRGVQPVERQEIIVSNKETKTYTIDPIAIDPITKEPIKLTFINNQAALAGDGTFENPFSTLANAQANTTAGDNIYIFAGDGTTTGYNTGWIIQNNQRFLGSAAAHEFQTTKGSLTVPIQTNIFPQITNTGNVIRTPAGVGASNFEIAGVYAAATAVNFVFFLEGQNITLKNNLCDANSIAGGVVAIIASGNLLIDRNIFQNSVGTGLLIFKDGIHAPANTLNAVVTNNKSIANAGSNIQIQVDAAATGMQNYTITGNLLANSTSSPGLYLFFPASGSGLVTTRATINANTMLNNHDDGMHIQQLTSGTEGFYHVFDNVFIRNNLYGAGFQASAGATLCLNLHDNLSYFNNNEGYQLDVTGGTIITEPFINDIGTFKHIGDPTTPAGPCACRFCTLPSDD